MGLRLTSSKRETLTGRTGLTGFPWQLCLSSCRKIEQGWADLRLTTNVLPHLLVVLEDDVEVPLGDGGVVLAGPLDSDGTVHLEGGEERGLGYVPGNAPEEDLAREDRAAHDALGQLPRPGARRVVEGGAVAIGASRVVQGGGAVSAAASTAVEKRSKYMTTCRGDC